MTSLPRLRADGDLAIDGDGRSAGVAEPFRRHVRPNGGLDIVIGGAADRGDARAFARGVRQHLPGLIGPAELENSNEDHEDEQQRQRCLDERRLALDAERAPRAACRHRAALERGVLT